MNLTAQQAALAWAQGKRVEAQTPSAVSEGWKPIIEINGGRKGDHHDPTIFSMRYGVLFRLAPGETMEEATVSEPETPVDDGGPAFPTPEVGIDIYDDAGKLKCCRVYPPSRGRSLRQHYAGLAMQGLCANPHNGDAPESIAKDSVAIADALLAELRRKR